MTTGSALDVVEIDAASNTGVDNIRELIERAQFAPVQCRYKLYVLDEVHMLSTAAFNALLKTLEEPPERVVFVLATTDPQRVLPTIISRCQRFDFRRIPLPSMIKHLSYIAAEEAINISESAIALVAQISQGGLRDAESLLDQLSLQTDEITVETVWDLVGAVPERDLLNLVRAIAADDGVALLDRVRNLMDKGREPLIVLQSLVGFYRDLLIAQRSPNREDLVAITPPTWAEMKDFSQSLSAAHLLLSQQKLQAAEVQVKNTTQPRLWLEITLTSLLPSALSAASEASGSVAKKAVAKKSPAIAPQSTAPPPIATSSPLTETARPTENSRVSGSPVQPQSVSPVAAEFPTEPTPEPAKNLSPKPTAHSKSAPATEPESEAVRSKASAPESVSAAAAPEPATQTAAPDANSQPAAASTTTDPAFGSMADLWNQLLAQLQPRGTQMLMHQQGVLLGFDGVGAKVGFRSASLQKMAQDRIPNLEAAFEAVFNRPIKVSLEVVSSQDVTTTEVPEPPPPPKPPPSKPKSASVQTSVPASPSAPQSSTGGFQPALNSPGKSAQNRHQPLPNQPPATPQTSPQRAPSSNGVSAVSSGRSRLDPPPNLGMIDHDQEKIKRFANFFNGEIVSLDDEGEVIDSGSSSSRSNEPAAQPKLTDPGPDVPF